VQIPKFDAKPNPNSNPNPSTIPNPNPNPKPIRFGISMSVPNFKRTALFVQRLKRGSQNFGIGSRDPGHADLRVIL